MVRPGSRRNAVNWAMKTKGYTQKRACSLAGIDPRVYRRTSKRPADTELRARMKELASERRRFGYRSHPLQATPVCSPEPGSCRQASDEPGQCFGIVATDDPQPMT